MGHARSGKSNRLTGERSPYLLQHAGNPVEWWPWGEQAVEEARRLDRPLFVSIGYATCHWCHVMARESFEHPTIAALLAEHCVCVKVDREERPEVDEVCMTACQIFTQLTEGRPSGGWPLSIWLEPRTLMPFFVGTYFPPAPAHGRPSFTQVIEALGSAWRDRRSEVSEQARRLGTLVTRQLSLEEGVASDSIAIAGIDGTTFSDAARDAATRLMSMQDRSFGGFGGAPKFPQPCFLELLLATPVAAATETDASSMRGPMGDAVRRTLVAMAAGGIFDQLGGGFHRYAVDHAWIVPHFEKMLYDNGQLASLYARASDHFGEPRFLRVAERIGDFVLRELTSPEGAFFCALDAEVDGREGEGYVWTGEAFAEALEQGALGEERAWAESAFGLSAGANFRDPHHEDAKPSHVLLDRISWQGGRPGARLDLDARSAPLDAASAARLERVRKVLLHARDAGPRPSTDDKIVPAWNGFMIEGLAETARAIRRGGGERTSADRFGSAAARATRFILEHMRRADGSLCRVWRHGASQVEASLEDYGSLACGMLALACLASQEEKEQRVDSAADSAMTSSCGLATEWISAAGSLLAEAERRFADGRGGWYDAPQSDLLFVRARSLADGALPSGTSLMVEAHFRLAVHETWRSGDDSATRRSALRAHPSHGRAVAALRAAAPSLAANPMASTALLASAIRHLPSEASSTR